MVKLNWHRNAQKCTEISVCIEFLGNTGHYFLKESQDYFVNISCFAVFREGKPPISSDPDPNAWHLENMLLLYQFFFLFIIMIGFWRSVCQSRSSAWSFFKVFEAKECHLVESYNDLLTNQSWVKTHLANQIKKKKGMKHVPFQEGYMFPLSLKYFLLFCPSFIKSPVP